MSAIFGLVDLAQGVADQATVTRMGDALLHRGPLAGDLWRSGTVGLGVRSSQAEPPSDSDRRPFVHGGSGVVAVADARIDNRQELARSLGLEQADRLSDGEIILHAYLRWGSDCAIHLIGDFSFAIWDPREHTLLCARDPMGVKPLYYHYSPRQFAFATGIKALHCVPGVSRELDEEQVAIFLSWSQPDRERTLFRAVQRLPAAHTLQIRPGGAPESRRYWSLDAHRELPPADPREWEARFRELFLEAVRCRLPVDAPVATALSGGLDSSAIACAARNFTNGPDSPEVHALSLVFPDLPSDELRLIDERAYIEEVVRGGGVHWHPVRADRTSPLQDVDQALAHLDLPYSAPNLYLHWAMYRAAREAGAAVFLDGLDGDTVVSHGLGRLNGLLRARKWEGFEREVRSFARHREIDPGAVLPHFGIPFLEDLARRARPIAWAEAALQLRRRFGLSARHLIVRRGFSPWAEGRRGASGASARTGLEFLTPELARFVADREREMAASASITTEREAHLEGLSQPAYQQTLEIADASAAAFRVEPRYPFFDRRLIEFCLAVPEEQKFANGWTRFLFRRAMEGILPPAIQWRPSKANLSPGFHRGFRGADRSLVEATDMSQLAPYADVGALRRIRRGYFADERRAWGDPDSYLVFRAAVFARWRSRVSGAEGSLLSAAEAA